MVFLFRMQWRHHRPNSKSIHVVVDYREDECKTLIAILSLVNCPCLLERFLNQRFQQFASLLKLVVCGQESSESKFGLAVYAVGIQIVVDLAKLVELVNFLLSLVLLENGLRGERDPRFGILLNQLPSCPPASITVMVAEMARNSCLSRQDKTPSVSSANSQPYF
jgi:hypothetical protein